MKTINICNHFSQGLHNDHVILKDLFKDNYKVYSTEYSEYEIQTKKTSNIKYDYQIFLEHIAPNLLKNSDKNYFIPNVEMINSTDLNCLLKHKITDIIAKTQYTYELLNKYSELKDIKIHKWNWNSFDRKVENVEKDYNQYLHLKGQSRFKQSQMLIDIWLKHPEWPMLHIVHNGIPNVNGYLEIKKPIVFDNITLYQYKLEEKELNNLMNMCGVHICTSSIEGYGHYINEARSTGSVIISSDAKPMNELVINNYNGLLVEVEKYEKCGFGLKNILNEECLKKILIKCFSLDTCTKMQMGNKSRELYEKNQELFFKNHLH